MALTECLAVGEGSQGGSEGGDPRQMVLWELGRQEVTVEFSADQVVTDTGLLAVRKLDRQLGFLAEVASRLPDPRSPILVVHDVERLVVQQVYQFLAGYFDACDSNVLRHDPLFQTLADRPPDAGTPLASGSTVARFRYAYTRRQQRLPVDERTIEQECQRAKWGRLKEVNRFLVETLIKTRPRPPRRVILDLDTSDDPAHGRQQLTLWHGYYDQQQYLALLAFDGESGFPLGAWLHPGTAHASWGAVEAITEIVQLLRAAWPDVEIILRGDTGFAVPAVYDYAETAGLKYILGYSTNAVLKHRTELWQNYAQAHAELHGGPCCVFTELRDYQAESWPHPRRVLAKCEVTAQGGPNRRFVVTNLPGPPAELYHGLYVQRGNYPERGIQELKHGLQMDRLSAHRFFANAFTLQCHVLAYALWTLFREANADVPEVARHQLQTVRSQLFKAGAVVQCSVRRVWFRLSRVWPGRTLFVRVCRAVDDFTARLGPLWPNRLAERLAIKLGSAVALIK